MIAIPEDDDEPILSEEEREYLREHLPTGEELHRQADPIAKAMLACPEVAQMTHASALAFARHHALKALLDTGEHPLIAVQIGRHAVKLFMMGLPSQKA